MRESVEAPATGLEPLSLAEAAALTGSLQRELRRVIIGQDQVIAEILTAFLAGGHVLLRGVPGLAKDAPHQDARAARSISSSAASSSRPT